ncbi:MAG TPA: hypothetical protein VME23_11150 [Terracidiphilus sp.]|nr:hypothetical protein [Terracidiphilus sp.]
MKALQALGVDGPVSFTFLARVVNILGSTGTVLLIVRFLTPVEQGYYYTLLSLVALEMIFELGFSFVVQQLAAHECIHLTINMDGSVSGDAGAQARLASIIQLSVRWYRGTALIMGMLLAPLGLVFFARHATHTTAQVAFQGPWLLAVAAAMSGLLCTPFYSFLDGCGQVRAVAAMRLRQAGASTALAWSAMVLHHGLFAPCLVIVGRTGMGFLFLVANRRFLLGLLKYPVRGGGICWARDVLPFQWRIAVSWMCSYFTIQLFIPILFATCGPVQAGQMGMSLSITGYMSALVLPWVSTKATPFGRLVAQRQFQGLDQLFRRTLGQSLAVFALIALCACVGAALLPAIAPRLAARMVSPRLFAVLVVAAGAKSVVESLATLLRSFKREPFLLQSLAVAALTLALAALVAPRWGDAGVTFSYLGVTAGVALPSALTIFERARRGYLSMAPRALIGGSAR